MNIVCFGDSNTFGYDPRGFFGGCYDHPWPCALSDLSGWKVRNLGENGRQIPLRPVNFAETTDLLIIMLGTNDLLQGCPAKAAAARMEAFLKSLDMDTAKILVIAPPAMKPGAWVSSQGLIDASMELQEEYHRLCMSLGIRFVNSGPWNIPLAYDGVHFTEEGHALFAEMLYASIRTDNCDDITEKSLMIR